MVRLGWRKTKVNSRSEILHVQVFVRKKNKKNRSITTEMDADQNMIEVIWFSNFYSTFLSLKEPDIQSQVFLFFFETDTKRRVFFSVFSTEPICGRHILDISRSPLPFSVYFLNVTYITRGD